MSDGSTDASGVRFVYFGDDERTVTAGHPGDTTRARRHRVNGERLLWFVHAGREYVSRARDVMDEVERIWHPIREAARGQGETGRALGATASRAGALAAQQAAVASQLAAATLREASGPSDEVRASAARERQRLEAEIRQLRDQLSALSESMGRTASGGQGLEAASAAAGTRMRELLARLLHGGEAEPVT